VRGPMQTECIPGQLEFEGFDGRRVVVAFDGGAVTSDAGTVLLREADRAIGLIERVAACFTDHREAEQVVHALPTLIGQRIVAIALGYEDINDLSRLLRLLLLPAALCLLRPASLGGEAPALEHRRRGRGEGRGGAPPTSGGAGRRCGSCCAPIVALPARS
jgi:Transposase DDE domain group 1